MRRYDDGHKNSLGKGFTALRRSAGLNVRLGLGQVHHATAFFPLAALFQQLNPLETLQNVPFGYDSAGSSKTAMLRHKLKNERPS